MAKVAAREGRKSWPERRLLEEAAEGEASVFTAHQYGLNHMQQGGGL